MKKNKFQIAIEKMNAERADEVQRLIKLPIENLEHESKHYYGIYIICRDSGYTESMEVYYLKHQIIEEALDVKTGNEIQAWDFLT